MSMRMLLGYDPKDTKKRPGTASTLSSNTSLADSMATFKYNVPMSKVRRLPPIREEGLTPGKASRNSMKGKPSPRDIFVASAGQTFVKSRNQTPPERPVSRVKPIPRERDQSSPDSFKKPRKKFPDTMQSLSPLDVRHTLVDGLVADYLHYAKYGHIIPVYEGTSVLTCPCCTSRNRQNVRSLLGFENVVTPENKARKYDKKSYVWKPEPEEEPEPELTSYDRMFPNSLYASIKRKKEPSMMEQKMHKVSEESRKQSWMAYQPLPYATNYLNPEFNRPAVIKEYLDSQPTRSYSYITGQVLDADTKFDSAMNKLERFSFGRSSYSE